MASSDQEFVDWFREYLGNKPFTRKVFDRLCAKVSEVQSPIERRMLTALASAHFFNRFDQPAFIGTMEECRVRRSLGDWDTFIVPQAEVPPYRVDFLVFFDRPIQFVVECDGHDFHEKTPQQAQHDKARDRALMSAGYPVLRFTGSEIWRDVDRCVGEVKNYFHSCLERQEAV